VLTTLVIHCSSPLRPASRKGSVTFSMALSVGMRLYAWNTNPIRSRRRMVSSWSFSELRSASPMKARPDVSESSPATQCSSVDFPEPDGPMIAVNRPVAKPTVTSSSARTCACPVP